MNLKKLGIIIQREYLNKVKKKSFLLTTFGVPILFAGIYAVMLFVMLKAEGDSKRIAVIDNSGIVMEKLEDTKLITFKQLSETDPEAVKNRLGEYDADILLYISPLDSATKSVTATTYADKPMGMETAEVIERRINDAVESYRIDSYDIPGLEQIMEDVQFNIHLTSYTVDEEGKETISQSEVYMIVSMVLAMALYMFIALFSGMVMSSVIEEKTSRVVEVLVSSVKSTELMFGKIIGVALVALTQFLLWIVLTGLIIGIVGGIIGMDKITGTLSQNQVETMPGMTSMNDAMGNTLDLQQIQALTDTAAVAEGPTGMEAVPVRLPAVCVAVRGHRLGRGERGGHPAAADSGDDSAAARLLHRLLRLPRAGKHDCLVGLDDSFHLADRHAGPPAFRRPDVGTDPVHRPPHPDLLRLRLGICEDLQGGYPHVRQEIYLQRPLEMVKAKLAVLCLLAAVSCSQGPRMEWKRVPMDGSRTGVVAVNAENVDTALGAFEDDYIAPNGRHFTDGATPEVAAMLMEVQPKMAHLKKVVGHNARFMDNPRTECDLPIGNLVADALRAKAADYFQVPVEFALTNYGGIRIPMPEGAVTLDDIESMFPFKNYMCLAKLRGSELTRLLEQLAKTPAFQAVSGCRVKVKAHELVEAEVDGAPIDPKRLYNVATIDFLLSGGDGIAVGARAEDVKLTSVLMKDVMLDFISAKEAAGEIIDYQKDGRVVMED